MKPSVTVGSKLSWRGSVVSVAVAVVVAIAVVLSSLALAGVFTSCTTSNGREYCPPALPEVTDLQFVSYGTIIEPHNASGVPFPYLGVQLNRSGESFVSSGSSWTKGLLGTWTKFNLTGPLPSGGQPFNSVIITTIWNVEVNGTATTEAFQNAVSDWANFTPSATHPLSFTIYYTPSSGPFTVLGVSVSYTAVVIYA